MTFARLPRVASLRGSAPLRGLATAAVALTAAIGLTGAGGVLTAQPAAASPTVTLEVSPSGADSGNCVGAACATLGYALGQAAADDTIVLEPGTYDVSADPSGMPNTVPENLPGLVIESAGSGGDAANTIVDAEGELNGLLVLASDVTIDGITIEDSLAQGILETPPSTPTPDDVTGEHIENSVVDDGDQCELAPSTPGCAGDLGDGDYGGSIQLRSVVDSTLEGTTVENSATVGILVTDELGPNDGNTIENDDVVDSHEGCGITLAGHNAAAVYSSGPEKGQPDPTAAGIYDETVEDNVVNDNIDTGIGLFNYAYDNVIDGNTLDGNGDPGIEVDSTATGNDLNGNTIEDNTVGVNSFSDGPGGDSPGQHTVHATATSGIMVIALKTPVTGTLIEGNTVTGDYYGIWMSALASGTTVSGNSISVAAGGLPVFVVPAPDGSYRSVGSDGGVYAFGEARYAGSVPGLGLRVSNIVALATTPDGGGYWLVGSDGGVFAFGDAPYDGSVPGQGIHVSDVVGIAVTPDGGGYWLVGSDGGVYAFGDAGYAGSVPGLGLRVSNIVAVATTPGGGYWLVGSDGGVFAFGDAGYFGSVPSQGIHIHDVVGVATTPDGGGYWLVGSDGGIFSYGDAPYDGSVPGQGVHVHDIVGVAPASGGGYWLVGSDGGVYTYGDAGYAGSVPGLGIHVSDVVALDPVP